MSIKTIHLPLTPCERFNLHVILHNKEQIIKTALEGKSLRRTARLLGLEPIRRAAIADPKERVNQTLIRSHEPAVFQLTEEAEDVLKQRVVALPRTPAQEFTLGDFLDRLEKREAVADTEDIPMYGANPEDWNFVAAPDIELTEVQIEGMKKVLTPQQFKELFG